MYHLFKLLIIHQVKLKIRSHPQLCGYILNLIGAYLQSKQKQWQLCWSDAAKL